MRFGSRKKEEKLYKQWAKYSGLPPEAIPQKEAQVDRDGRRVYSLQNLNALYILLGVFIVLFCIGLVVLIIQSC